MSGKLLCLSVIGYLVVARSKVQQGIIWVGSRIWRKNLLQVPSCAFISLLFRRVSEQCRGILLSGQTEDHGVVDGVLRWSKLQRVSELKFLFKRLCSLWHCGTDDVFLWTHAGRHRVKLEDARGITPRDMETNQNKGLPVYRPGSTQM